MVSKTSEQETQDMLASAQRIYLTGPMASGKSTVGRLVASQLDWHFLDLDDRIEQKAGKTIPEIFEQDGEALFRDKEKYALYETTDHFHTVIATGGGALVQPGMMTWAREHGLVVYLRVDVTELARRAREGSDNRPLLSGGDEMVDTMASILDKRRSTYEKADLIVDASRSPEGAASEIRQFVQERSRRNE